MDLRAGPDPVPSPEDSEHPGDARTPCLRGVPARWLGSEAQGSSPRAVARSMARGQGLAGLATTSRHFSRFENKAIFGSAGRSAPAPKPVLHPALGRGHGGWKEAEGLRATLMHFPAPQCSPGHGLDLKPSAGGVCPSLDSPVALAAATRITCHPRLQVGGPWGPLLGPCHASLKSPGAKFSPPISPAWRGCKAPSGASGTCW